MYSSQNYNCQGDSRWATPDEVKRSCSKINLAASHYPAAGIPLFSDGKTAFVDNLDHHTVVFGATGSKKTRIFGMPSINIMIGAGESFIATDPKGELYNTTALRAKKEGYDIILLNFRDIGKGDCWNPLALPYDLYQNGRKDEAIMMANDVLNAISSSHQTQDPYWSETAVGMAIGALSVLIETANREEMNMASLAAMTNGEAAAHLSRLSAMMSDSSIASVNLKGSIVGLPERTMSCVLSTLFSMMRVFNAQKQLVSMLSQSSFDMSTVGRKKTAVYLIIPDEKTTFHFLVTVFIKQIYEVLISEAQKEKDLRLPVRVNFVLDEFSNIPCIPDMASMISAARSRNIRFFLILQSMHQLRKKYGDEDAEVIKGNCENWVFLASKELSLLNEISELCGTVHRSNGEVRPLISPSELQRLSKQKGEALVLHARCYPIISRLMDIGEYEMFRCDEQLEMKSFEMADVKVFNLAELLGRISRDECPPPSPSERYRYRQCCRIRDNALAAAKDDAMNLRITMDVTDPDDPDEEEHSFRYRSKRRTHRFSSTWGDEPPVSEEEPPKKKTEKELEEEAKRLEKYRALAEERKTHHLAEAKKKITAFYGEAYAERFFSENYVEHYCSERNSLFEDDD